jgi:hypothetical protein
MIEIFGTILACCLMGGAIVVVLGGVLLVLSLIYKAIRNLFWER